MPVIAILSFVAIFAVIAPLLFFVSGGAKAGNKKQVIAALDSAIGAKPEPKKKTADMDFRKNENASALPWLSRRLAELQLGPRLQGLVSQAGLKWTPGALVLLSLACFAIPAYLAKLRTGSVILSLLIGAAIGFIPFGYVLFMRAKRMGKFEQGLPDALELMVSALRVGHSFNSAIGLITRECPDPISTEFKIAFDEQNYGLDLRTALENLKIRVPLQDVKMVVTAILIQRESGGNLAEVLEKTAYVIRQRFRLRKQVQVHTAQGRLTGLILSLLPLVLGLGLYIVNPGTMSLLWTRDIGIKLMIAGGCMLVIGALIIQKIVRMEV